VLRSVRWLSISLGLLVAPPALAEAPDWSLLREVDRVEVVTTDEDGAARETTVWLAVLDGAGYVRTGTSRWGDNVVRSPELELRALGSDYPMRVEFVEDDGLRERVSQAFREKYGFSDWAVSWIRGSRPKIMHLHPRE
jgi:hypothetical protein